MYPDPERFAQKIADFRAQASSSTGDMPGVVFIGSSSIAYWADTLGDDFAPLSVIPRGFGGSNLNDINYFFNDLFVGIRPRGVVLYGGGHDINHGATAQQVLVKLDEFTGRLRDDFPDCEMVYFSIKPIPIRFHLWPICVQANDLIKAAYQADPNFHFLDMSSCLLGEDGQPCLELYRDDMVHLSELGYQRWISVAKSFICDELGWTKSA